jgi:hypothetical protein
MPTCRERTRRIFERLLSGTYRSPIALVPRQ